MPRALKLFALFTVGAFLLGSVGYLALHAVMPRGHVFGGLYRMFLYHESHPFQYIAVVALTYGVIATACALRWSCLAGWRRSAAIIGIIVATVLVASVPGGVLWKIHDMQAGYFTKGAQFWSDLLWGASTGLQAGWLVIALSLPYNIIGLILGYVVTHFGFRISRPVA
ncbi:MAG: hypothetical protein FJ405_06260 [Verrucomicrobia bacterium]|nr:hypothetical protein [Verrucomicrobiota bacterium]